MQMWLTGIFKYCPDQPDWVIDFLNYGIDVFQYAHDDFDESTNAIEVPQFDCPFSMNELVIIRSFQPLANSCSFGIDIYVSAFERLDLNI